MIAKKKTGEAGFTLIEIVIAVAIIGIFAAVISPMVFRHLADAKVSKAYNEAETIGKQHFNLALTSARRQYYADASYHIERAIELIPYLAPAWRLAVKIELKRGRFDTAQEFLEEGLRRFPNETYLASMALVLNPDVP